MLGDRSGYFPSGVEATTLIFRTLAESYAAGDRQTLSKHFVSLGILRRALLTRDLHVYTRVNTVWGRPISMDKDNFVLYSELALLNIYFRAASMN